MEKMKNSKRRDGGMTLIELMVTVTILAVLISVAIPAFTNYQLNSKRAEAYGNLSGIAKAQQGRYAEFGLYAEAAMEPAGGPLIDKQSSSSVIDEFASVGWSPDGEIYYAYDVVTGNSTAGDVNCASCGDGCFTASAYGDLDGDGGIAMIIYVQADAQENFCNAWLNPDVSPPIKDGARVFNQVIRIDPYSNASVDDY